MKAPFDVRKYCWAAAAGVGTGPATVLLASQTSPLITLGLAASGLLAASMLLWPFWSILVTTLSVPLERIGRLTDDSSSYTFSIMRVMGLLNLTCLILHWSLSRRKIKISLPLLLYATYIVFGVLSLTHTTDWMNSLRQTPAMVGNVLFFFLIPNLVQTKKQIRIVLGFWLAITTFIGAFTIYGWHKGISVTDNRMHSTGERSTDERFAVVLQDASEYDLAEAIPRALGPTSHPAVYGINTIMTLPFFAYFFTTVVSRKWKAAIAVAGLIACYNVLLTNTRAAFLAFLFVLALIAWTRIIKLNWRVVALGAVLIVLMIPVMPRALSDRILNPDNYGTKKAQTLNARFLFWEAALQTFSEHPFFGVGMGNQSEVPRRVRLIHTPPNASVHCEYLNSLVEVGITGYVFLVAFFVVVYRRCRAAEKAYLAAGDQNTALILTAARVLFIGVLFYAVQVDCFHFPLKGWWLVMGLVMVLYELAGRREPPAAAIA